MAASRSLNLRFLQADQVKVINKVIEGTSSVLRDEGLLDSAMHSPINQQHYGQENDSLQPTATLSYKISKNHAFANGNKRTALLAANAFSLQNGMGFQPEAELGKNSIIEQAHVDVASDHLEEASLGEIYRNIWEEGDGGD
ncbi:MAG: hypothetical protein M1837_004700 [Sclerophora amabilis]|nr:MAG: hypothetical protein M1837_004700 [Sclerophora amabilis]